MITTDVLQTLVEFVNQSSYLAAVVVLATLSHAIWPRNTLYEAQ